MNNPYDALPSYIKETPKYSKFLELVNAYIISGALEMSLFKNSFLAIDKPTFVIQALANQLKVEVELPFVDGKPDWSSYYERLFLAYRAKTFNISFTGKAADFITGDPLRDVSSMVVIDFSVAKVNKAPMSVVYSVLSMDHNLTIEIVRDVLVPNVTGVNASLYYLQFGQEVFGYDIDEKAGIRIGPDHVNTVPIDTNPYSVTGVTIRNLGTGYQVGDTVTTAGGIQLQITDLEAGAFLSLLNPSNTYATDPTASGVAVTGGSGSGMTVDVVGTVSRGYFIRGFDNGAFISITRRGNQ